MGLVTGKREVLPGKLDNGQNCAPPCSILLHFGLGGPFVRLGEIAETLVLLGFALVGPVGFEPTTT
jgi:hypothetical protein